MTNEAQIIDDLQIWFAKCKAALLGDGYQVELAKSPPDRGKPSVSITIASSRRIGQLTVWSTGEAELGMGDADSGMVSEEHRGNYIYDRAAGFYRDTYCLGAPSR